MPSNFSSLRSSRKSLLTKLSEEIKKDEQKQGADERFWKLTVDAKTKIGFARIRFLPAPKGEDIPWVRVWSHGFKGPNGSWFIENCPTTRGIQDGCPVCKDNNRLWNSGVESDKVIARNRKRKLSFISNILVVEDPAHPENNGKVFLFRYGKKIHDKIKELIEPEFPDAKPADPFNLWEGCDFKLKSQHKDGFQNYDKSEFADPTELFKDDDKAKEALWGSEYLLQPFVAESEFKLFNTLNDRMQKVLTGAANAPRTAEEASNQSDEVAPADDDQSVRRTRGAKPPKDDAPTMPAPEDEDDIKNFFKGLNDDEA